ncbi:hypothetical protein [Marinactinospora rubrisoli]|uniref:Uncharacterized protein n=1 Tax=Marinactinospora rubrisoli TaxID=2715399 RepID=A0ABW2KFM0_9ACTN
MRGTAEIVLAIGGGYLLGRRRKLRLAVMLAGWLAFRRLGVNPQRLLADLKAEIGGLPVVDELRGQAKDELLSAGRDAAGLLATNWIDRAADALRRRSDALEDVTDEERAEETEEEPAGEREPEPATAGRRGADDAGERGRERARATATRAASRTAGRASTAARRATGTRAQPPRPRRGGDRGGEDRG